jgi:hypothetical protein
MKGYLLVTMVALGLVASAQAANLHQGFQFESVSASIWADNSEDGSVSLGADASSAVWSIESVQVSLYPDYRDTSEWNWSVWVNGRRDLSPTSQSMSFSSRYDGEEVSFGQSNYLGNYFDDYRGLLVNDAGAHAGLSPATFDWGYASYQTWENTYGGGGGGGGGGKGAPTIEPSVTEKWWGINFSFHGSFGNGPEGDALGRTYFGTVPEPASLGLLTVGSAVLFRRRRR